MMDHTLKIAATVLTQKQGGSTSDKGLPPQTTYCSDQLGDNLSEVVAMVLDKG